MSGVLVVFIARDPGADVLKMVGYYENATIRNERFEINHSNFKVRAMFRTEARKARIIDLPRSVVIPTFQGDGDGVGQSTLWYADNHPEIVAKVRRLGDHGAALGDRGAAKLRARQPSLLRTLPESISQKVRGQRRVATQPTTLVLRSGSTVCTG
ncbi:hypothetical protein DFR29_12827 [Tahibacter aquaticus]|uniref:Uncharacterized protein n=1 Tax=Tahibacter aquaticus TaxID=520092 RepID=A0A4R6YIE0_9GAMM|nr:hypothetical protein [Tahibacter aquaticus]TDR36606.1 hypothetical protein DFR29_12827 [Tahibacter aquaticus]